MADETTSLISTWRILRKRRTTAISVAVAIFSGVAIYTFTRVPVFQSESLLLMDNPTSVPLVQAQEKLDKEFAVSSSTSLATEIQILKSKSLITRAVDSLKQKYPTLDADVVAENIGIFQIEDAGVLSVAYRDVIPERVVAVLNALGKVYVDYSLETRRSQASNAIRFIEKKLPQAEKELQTASQELREFRTEKGISDPGQLATAMTEATLALQKQEEQANIAVQEAQQAYAIVQRRVGKSAEDAMTLSILSQNAQYQKYLEQLQETEYNYAIERARFKEANPAVKVLRERRDQLLGLVQAKARELLGAKEANRIAQSTLQESLTDGSIAENQPNVGTVPTTYESMQIKQVGDLLVTISDLKVRQVTLNGVRRALQETNAKMREVPALQDRYANLVRTYVLTETNYTNLKQKLEELTITEAQESSPWKVIEPPYLPDEQISPKTIPNLLIGLVAGALLGVGAALLLELLDERVKSVEEAKELTQLPLLGALPKSDVFLEQNLNEDDPTRSFQRSPFKEALRSLSTNLRYLGSDRKLRVLGFTSSIPAEGKSTITYNLAVVMAELGRKVVVIDADMRKPSLHKLLEMPNANGLSTVLATDCSWQDVIIETDKPNLWAITSGPLPPNPVTLLDSQKLVQFIQELKENFDYVIFDTPPVVGLTDAQILAAHLDGMVLVAALERSNRSALQRATEMLRNSAGNLVGLVVNLLDEGSEGYYHQYYYSYYYGEAVSNPNQKSKKNAPPTPNKGNVLTNLFRSKDK